MLVAQIIAGARHGGAELFFERLSIALYEAGEAVLPVIRREPGRAARLRAAGLTPRELRFGGVLDLCTRPRLGRILRDAAPNAVVTWMGRAAAATRSGSYCLVGRLGGAYDLKRFRHCDHLVANTAALADWIIAEGFAPARVHCLPNFVPDLRGAAPADRMALGVPGEATMVLALGRLHPAKGFDTLIRALPDLPRVHAVIAGEGDERAGLIRLAAGLGVAERVHLPGWREDTGALLAACDVFVCPSRYEPLGNAVLEAWSAGRPVIAAAAAGPAGLIRDQTDGVLVAIDDPSALAGALAALCGEPARAAALAHAGRERYCAGFAEPAVVHAWRLFLHQVAR